MEDSESATITTDEIGSPPETTESLKPKRVIRSISQAMSVCETLEEESSKIVTNQARIVAKIGGEPPFNSKSLKQKAKNKTNISTGALATECRRVPARLFMPIKTARYLTAAELPKGVLLGPQKTETFRTIVTETIRSWPKWNPFVRGLATEVGVNGFGFAAYFDRYDWRPNLVRGDKGFVPVGAEISEPPQFFSVRHEYKVHELIELAKKAKDADLDNWKIPAVVKAVNEAIRPTAGQNDDVGDREFEELVGQASVGFSYTKGIRTIPVKMLWAVEHNGKVSHWILWDKGSKADENDEDTDTRLLFEELDEYDLMWQAVIPLVFDYGDGTIHGSHGAGQILFDMAHQVELIRNDAIDALKNAGKLKIQVADPKDVNSVKLIINDTHIITTGTFAGNTAALPSDVNSFLQLDAQLSRYMQEKIGAYLPPIPQQPSDVKAAQVNAALAQEQEIREALLDNWLSQFAWVMYAVVYRLLDKESEDEIAKRTRQALLDGGLTEEEIEILRTQPPLKNVTEFTPFKTMQVAAFAQTKAGNPLYNQRNVEVAQVNAVAGHSYVDEFLLPEGDTATIDGARRQQQTENAAMVLGQDVPVLPSDQHWYHMQEMKQGLIQTIQQGNLQVAQLGLKHYTAHYDTGVQTKTLPKEVINSEKSFIAEVKKVIEGSIENQMEKTAQEQGLPPGTGKQMAQEAIAQTQQAQKPPPNTKPNLPAPNAPQPPGQISETDPNV